MTLYLPCRERPERFELNPRAPLANGLVFAGLGALPGTTHYHDSSLHGNDGELTNMTPSDDWVWIDELGRRGLDFDYIDDYVHCGSNVGLFSRTAVTHVAWVRQSRAIVYNRITCCGRSASTAPYLTFGLRSNTTYTVPGSPGGTYNEYNTGVSVASYLDEWVSFAATYDSQQVIAYLNGSVIGPGSGAWTGALGDLSAVSRYAAIGRDTYSARYFEGQIADPLIYNRALTLPEIQALADPSNAMLSGLLLPPRRTIWNIGWSSPEEETSIPVIMHHRRLMQGAA